jgi:hypothetical protein
MSEIGEAVTGNAPDSEEESLHDCEWSSCKKNHKKKPVYPKGGYYTKRDYRQKWISAGMQPWDPKTYGRGRKRLREDGGSYETMTYEYVTQAHHLIPTTLLKETSTLKENLVLIGYDCDAPANGMMLPQFKMDIPLHHLQAHEGNHPPDYMRPIRDELRRIEIAADGICSVDTEGTIASQKQVAMAIDALSSRARMKILAIRTGKSFWPVRTDAFHEYNEALKEYALREQIHIAKHHVKNSQGT